MARKIQINRKFRKCQFDLFGANIQIYRKLRFCQIEFLARKFKWGQNWNFENHFGRKIQIRLRLRFCQIKFFNFFYFLQIVPSTAILQNYQTIDNPKIEKWIETFVKQTNLSGLLCFDFLEDQAKNVYCIECNPRPHSAIVTINSPEEVK